MSTFDQNEFGELSAYLDRFVGSLDQFVAQLNQPSESPE
jgi:nitrate/nitrite-specific signal transduction histidine kinase